MTRPEGATLVEAGIRRAVWRNCWDRAEAAARRYRSALDDLTAANTALEQAAREVYQYDRYPESRESGL